MSFNLWTQKLLSENKTEVLDRALRKPSFEGFSRDVLSSESKTHVVGFDRAPLSCYIDDLNQVNLSKISTQGVGDIFLSEKASVQKIKSELLLNFIQSADMGDGSIQKPLTARKFIKAGANSVQELIYLYQLIQNAKVEKQLYVEIYLDSELFSSIAKIRALKSLAPVKVIGRINPRYFSTIDEENNVLKNSSAVMAGYLGGVVAMESLPHTILTKNDSHSLHLALSSQLILQAESHMEFVSDPGFGSWSIEKLTEDYIQDVKKYSFEANQFQAEVDAAYLETCKKINLRKLVVTGVNDFPNPRQKIELGCSSFKRPIEVFEQLRIKYQKAQPIKAISVVFGDYAQLQPRLNFIKNVVELLGLEVIDFGNAFSHQSQIQEWIGKEKPDVILWVAKDEDYEKLIPYPQSFNFVAGKKTITNAFNFYTGMDVIQTLNSFLDRWNK